MHQRIWAAYEWLAMLAGWSLLGLLCIAWLPLAILWHWLLPRQHGKRLGRLVIMYGFQLYIWFLQKACACHFDLSDLDRLPARTAHILVANHPSLLDAVLIVSRFPNMVCIMKSSLMDNLLLGSAARLACYIRNSPSLNMILDARNALQEQANVLIFPEGTRTSTFPINPLNGSAMLLSRQANVPVQTVLIEFSSPYLGKAWPLFRPPQLPLTMKVKLGRLFVVPTDISVATRELESYLSTALTNTTTD